MSPPTAGIHSISTCTRRSKASRQRTASCARAGAIILAAECWDGVPSHGQYGELLESTASLDELLQKICAPGFAVPDQWQAQIQAQIQLRAAVYLYSSLDDDTVRRTHLEPCGPLSERFAALMQAAGPDATACILPQGPQTVPYLAPDAGQGAWARQLAIAGMSQTRTTPPTIRAGLARPRKAA